MLLLVLVMVFALAACGESGNQTNQPANNNAPANNDAPASGDLKVGVFWYAFPDAFLSTVRSALDADLSSAGIDYQDFDSNNSQAPQLEQIQTAVTNGFNILVVNLVTSGSADAAQQIIQAAGSAHVDLFSDSLELTFLTEANIMVHTIIKSLTRYGRAFPFRDKAGGQGSAPAVSVCQKASLSSG